MNLQVLDYICGNIDRHPGNILYQFGKDKNGNVVLKGICGIDNDTSFGIRTFTENKGIKDITSLPSIKNISRSCYETLLNFPVDALRVVLADKLTKEELDAVCQRAELLKQRAQALEKGEEKNLNVVADHEWGEGKYTYDKLTANKSGITNTINAAIKGIERRKELNERKRIPNKASELVYTDGADVSEQAEVRFEEIYSKLEGFVSRAGELRGILHVNSGEYNNMLRSLKAALDSGKEIKENLKNDPNLDPARYDAFVKTVVKLGTASQEYMNAKNLSQSTELGKGRFALATDMRDLAHENFEVKEMPAKEKAEVKQPEEVNGPEL